MNASVDEMEDLADFHDADSQPVVDALNAYVEAPDPRVKFAHLAAIAAETAPLRLAADAGHRSAGRLIPRPTRRFRITPKRLAFLPAALVVAFLGTEGLAVAGVNLPHAARAPFDAVGLQLPNQSSASDVHAVIDTTPPADRGCAFGHAVAAAASQGRTHAPAEACGHQQGQSRAGAHGQAQSHAHGVARQSAEGQDNAASTPSGVPPTPPAGQEFGQSTAADAQQNASNDGQSFGEGTSQGAQSLTPSTPPAAPDAPSSSPGASNAGSPPGGSAPVSPPSGSAPGGSHAP
jgi:hypothetical protein